MIAGISHIYIAFGMRKGILHAFWSCGFNIENVNLRYLKVRNEWSHCIKRKPNLCVVWSPTVLVGSPAPPPHSTFGVLWHCWAPNSWSMTPHITQSFNFLFICATWLVNNLMISHVYCYHWSSIPCQIWPAYKVGPFTSQNILSDPIR